MIPNWLRAPAWLRADRQPTLSGSDPGGDPVELQLPEVGPPLDPLAPFDPPPPARRPCYPCRKITRVIRIRQTQQNQSLFDLETDHWRPQTLEECPDFRPCPYVGCRHHLYLEVTANGNLSLPWPGLEPWEIPETCSLDVAAQGGLDLESVGKVINLSRERIRQVEVDALKKAGQEIARLGLRVDELVDFREELDWFGEGSSRVGVPRSVPRKKEKAKVLAKPGDKIRCQNRACGRLFPRKGTGRVPECCSTSCAKMRRKQESQKNLPAGR